PAREPPPIRVRPLRPGFEEPGTAASASQAPRCPPAEQRRLPSSGVLGTERKGPDRRHPRGGRLSAQRRSAADDPLRQAEERAGQGLPASGQESLVLRSERRQMGTADRARADRRNRLAPGRL